MDIQFAKTLMQQLEQDYNRIADHFTQTRQKPWPEFERLATLLNAQNNMLDIGCGNGRLAEIAKKINAHYTGLDLSAGLIHNARQQYPEYQFVQGNMLELPFTDNHFDIITAIASLQHIPSEQLRQQALTEMARIAKPHATLFMMNWNLYQTKLPNYFVSDPNYDPGDTLIPWKDDQGNVLAERYYHGFTYEELEKLLANSAWKLVDQYYSANNIRTDKHEGYNIITIAKRV